MNSRLYRTIRDLHLYFGLLISPFLIVFALSTIVLNHRLEPEAEESRFTASVQYDPEGAPMDQARLIMSQLGVSGDIAGAGRPRGQNKFQFVVQKPGETTVVAVDLATSQAEVLRRDRGLVNAMIDLHMKPGAHRSQRMINWVYARIWSWWVDTIVYLMLFLAVSGVYMWTFLKAERTVGLVLLGLGTVTFVLVIAGFLTAVGAK